MNSRRFLAIVPLTGPVVGYRLTEPAGLEAKFRWLDNNHLELTLASGTRVFDLAADPPKPIP